MTWNPRARLLTTNEAAAGIKRPASTIRRWAATGYLRAHAHSRNGRPLYLELDVLKAEASARQATRRLA